MMVVLVLLLILLSGRLVVLLRSDGLRCGIGFFLPGPPDLWVGSWISTPISCRDIEVWPYSVGMLVKWVAFLHSLHWPADGCSLGVGGVSYVELLILYELWAGERLSLEKAHPRYLRPGRSISVSAVGLLVHCFGIFGICLLDFGDLFLVILVLITVGCGILGGSGVVMVLLPGPVSPRLKIF